MPETRVFGPRKLIKHKSGTRRYRRVPTSDEDESEDLQLLRPKNDPAVLSTKTPGTFEKHKSVEYDARVDEIANEIINENIGGPY